MTRLAVLSLVFALTESALADESARIAALEQRVAELEVRAAAAEARAHAAEGSSAPSAAPAELPLRISGSARFGWFDGGEDGATSNVGARVSDARLYLDAELGEDLRIGALPLARNVGFTFEWNLVRRRQLFNEVGELYFDLQGLGGSSWWNLRPGRFQIPVGEAYKRYSRGDPSNPFITQPLGGPWWWDEGVMLYGGSDDARVGYVASLTNGETSDVFDGGEGAQGTVKLWAQPSRWLYVSASGLYQGEIGASGGALWLGETWATQSGR